MFGPLRWSVYLVPVANKEKDCQAVELVFESIYDKKWIKGGSMNSE
jgi:hypothetical protein